MSQFKCCGYYRYKIRKNFLAGLPKVAGEVEESMKERVRACDPVEVAAWVELLMLKKLGPFNYGTKEVKLKYRSICFNVRDSNNPDLRRKILLGEVEPEKLVRMIPEVMARHKLRHEIGQIRERRLAKIRDKDDEEEEEEKSECDDAQ
ncbi:transcription elongation factor TFIIS [Citrus sinensis]|uniref:Transcription elongation factor TFIIS n=1 Tax=Citrus sinensis TaxID=2711 RepID=A0ACB8K2N1_CITSI|nr:transcription elongation factor TFIIS [Citrus sinensis]